LTTNTDMVSCCISENMSILLVVLWKKHQKINHIYYVCIWITGWTWYSYII